ncbi:MAG: hypothetical protein F6K47_15800 [Symploca sp. SIO2E6]|nr:hypothetical protein [Symploca sp. SIO2E6]
MAAVGSRSSTQLTRFIRVGDRYFLLACDRYHFFEIVGSRQRDYNSDNNLITLEKEGRRQRAEGRRF